MRAIHFLQPDELPAFRDFLETHWRPGHALARSQALLDWMYRDATRDEYHFVVAKDARDGSLEAVLGFLPLEHFDPALGDRDLWLQLWKVRDDRRGEGLGSELFRFLQRERQPRSICGFGLSEGVKRTYARLGFTLGALHHYFLADPRRASFRLLENWQPTAENAPRSRTRFVPLDAAGFERWSRRFDWRQADQKMPAKSAEFFRRRYFAHPIYRYEVFALAEGDRARAFAVLRLAGNGEAFALKWVDYYGDFSVLRGTAGVWRELLAHYDSEYVELHNLGMPPEVLSAAGFTARPPGASVIVPCYFEPFERRNVDIACAYWTENAQPYFIFKGDSDQDRPTWIPTSTSRRPSAPAEVSW